MGKGGWLLLGLGMCGLVALGLAGPRADKKRQAEATIKGTTVQWGGWSFTWKVYRREGVVLTDVHYQDKKVLKHAGLAEVFVPYNVGSPRIEDLVSHPLGENMIPLRPGLDCLPGGICKSFDKDGKEEAKRPHVMLHEEDASMVYLGKDGRGHGKVLTLWCAYELGDYTYLVQWRFQEDGTLSPRVGLTGRLAHFGGDDKTSVEVGADQRALAHVHNLFFCIDLDVDGPKNVVEEFEYLPTSDKRSRANTRWNRIKTEGGRDLDPKTFRTWRVANLESKNKYGNPRSYELVPGGTGVFRGLAAKKGGEDFTHHDLWVTRYHKGETPPPRPLKDALPGFVNGEAVENEDVVLYYMMSVHHQPRAEDWPAMPVCWHGFSLVPRDFLGASPVSPTR